MSLANSIPAKSRLRFRLHKSKWRGILSLEASTAVLDKETGEAESEMCRDLNGCGIDCEGDGAASPEMEVHLSFSYRVVPSNLAPIYADLLNSTKAVGGMAVRGETMKGSSIGSSTRMGYSWESP